jgi:hypothetical protein
MAEENRDWGYDRIVGALANLGYEISDQSVGKHDPIGIVIHKTWTQRRLLRSAAIRDLVPG